MTFRFGPELEAAVAAQIVGLAGEMGLDPALAARPGTSVAPAADRTGTGRVTWYRLGEHCALWCDPDIAPALRAEVAERGLVERTDLAAFEAIARDTGADLLGLGIEHLLPDGTRMPARPAPIRVLDGSDPGVVGQVGELLAACSDDDRDASDFDLEALDRYLTGWVEDGGVLAVAGARLEPGRPGFHDIGVLTHPTARQRGLGRAVVAAVTEEIVASGRRPLYRCDARNDGSRRLCRSLGFVETMRIVAYRWPRDD